MKKLGLYDNRAVLEEHPIKRAELLVKAEDALQELKDFYTDEKANDMVIKMWRDFEEMTFNMSQADKHMKVMDFLSLSAYDFFRYKDLLVKKLKPKSDGIRESV
jgi:hypothetical protein